MKKQMNSVKKAICLAFLSVNLMLSYPLVTLASDEANLPSTYPESFDVIGLAYEANREKAYIDVSARHYPLAPSVRYYTPDSGFNSLADIKHDPTVGLVFDSSKRVIGIYKLPNSFYQAN